MTTLFASIARYRPEWIAQGLLMHAMKSEPAVRALVLKAIGSSLSAEDVPEVREEQVTEVGWRADIVSTWPSGLICRMELKLLANLTQTQVQAVATRAVSLLVVPKDRDFSSTVPVLTWEEIAEAARTPELKMLLGQVNTASVWRLEELGQSDLETDLRAFFSDGDDAKWQAMYRFLSTVHEHLRALAPVDYEASDGWTCSRRAGGYYGFCFRLAGQEVPRFWMGFTGAGGMAHFELSVPSTKGEPVLLPAEGMLVEGPLKASSLAAQVLASARQYAKRDQ